MGHKCWILAKTFRSIGGLSREHRRLVGVMSQSGYRLVIDWSSCADVVFRVRGDRRNANKSRVNLLSIRSCLRLALVSHTSRVMRKWQMSCVHNRNTLQRYSKISGFANNCLRKSQQNEILDASDWLFSQIEAIIHFDQPDRPCMVDTQERNWNRVQRYDIWGGCFQVFSAFCGKFGLFPFSCSSFSSIVMWNCELMKWTTSAGSTLAWSGTPMSRSCGRSGL